MNQNSNQPRNYAHMPTTLISAQSPQQQMGQLFQHDPTQPTALNPFQQQPLPPSHHPAYPQSNQQPPPDLRRAASDFPGSPYHSPLGVPPSQQVPLYSGVADFQDPAAMQRQAPQHSGIVVGGNVNGPASSQQHHHSEAGVYESKSSKAHSVLAPGASANHAAAASNAIYPNFPIGSDLPPPSLFGNTNFQIGDDPILDEMARLVPPDQRWHFFNAVEHFDDEHVWVQYGMSVRMPVLKCLALHSFRVRLKIPAIEVGDANCLRWLCDLYMGFLMQDDQLRNLPFPVVVSSNYTPNVRYIWGHLMALTDTLSELKTFYAGGFVHLLSRKESQSVVKRPGEYVFRLSNQDVGTMIISTTSNHFYLSDRFVEAGVGPYPPGIAPTKVVRRYADKEFVIFVWTVELVEKLVRTLGSHMGLSGAPKTATVALSHVGTAAYSTQVNSAFNDLQSKQTKYMSLESYNKPQQQDAYGSARHDMYGRPLQQGPPPLLQMASTPLTQPPRHTFPMAFTNPPMQMAPPPASGPAPFSSMYGGAAAYSPALGTNPSQPTGSYGMNPNQPPSSYGVNPNQPPSSYGVNPNQYAPNQAPTGAAAYAPAGMGTYTTAQNRPLSPQPTGSNSANQSTGNVSSSNPVAMTSGGAGVPASQARAILTTSLPSMLATMPNSGGIIAALPPDHPGLNRTHTAPINPVSTGGAARSHYGALPGNAPSKIHNSGGSNEVKAPLPSAPTTAQPIYAPAGEYPNPMGASQHAADADNPQYTQAYAETDARLRSHMAPTLQLVPGDDEYNKLKHRPVAGAAQPAVGDATDDYNKLKARPIAIGAPAAGDNADDYNKLKHRPVAVAGPGAPQNAQVGQQGGISIVPSAEGSAGPAGYAGAVDYQAASQPSGPSPAGWQGPSPSPSLGQPPNQFNPSPNDLNVADDFKKMREKHLAQQQ